jgi:hypothetical protein
VNFFLAARLFDFLHGEVKAKPLNCVCGRRTQARAPDCGLDPCSAEIGSIRWREAGARHDLRNIGRDSLGRRDYAGD